MLGAGGCVRWTPSQTSNTLYYQRISGASVYCVYCVLCWSVYCGSAAPRVYYRSQGPTTCGASRMVYLAGTSPIRSSAL